MVEEDPGVGRVSGPNTNEVLSRSHTVLTDRVAAWRAGVSELMRHTWPEQCRNVENAAGVRMSDMPDVLLRAYLQSFAELARSGDDTASPSDLSEIRRALLDQQVELAPDAGTIDMAVAIRETIGTLRLAAEGPKAAAKKARSKKTHIEQSLQHLDYDTGVVPGDSDSSSGSSGLTKQQSDAIRTIVEVPAPRYMSDVVAAVGSTSAASVWEKSLQNNRTMAVVRPQDKWRERGALLVPTETMRDSIQGFHSSPWGRALATGLPGGRLYELGLVLRAVEGDIVASSVHKETAELTIRTPSQGVSGIVVALSAGSDPWAALEKEVHGMVRSGISQTTVIVCPSRQVDTVNGTLMRAGGELGWADKGAVIRVVGLPDWLKTGTAQAVTAAG